MHEDLEVLVAQEEAEQEHQPYLKRKEEYNSPLKIVKQADTKEKFFGFYPEYLPDNIRDNDVMKALFEAVELASYWQNRYAKNLTIYKKEDESQVTKADIKINYRLTKFFSEHPLFKDHIIIGEESHNLTDTSQWDKTKKYIVFDPIDGTKNYGKKGVYAVTLAEMEWSEKENSWVAINSIVASNNLGSCAYASKGCGGYVSGLNTPGEYSTVKIDHTNRRDVDLNIKDKVITINTFGRGMTQSIREELNKETASRNTGCTSIDMCRIAIRYDAGIFLGTKLNPWDVEAALLFVKETKCTYSRKNVCLVDPKTGLEVEHELILGAKSPELFAALEEKADGIIKNFNRSAMKQYNSNYVEKPFSVQCMSGVEKRKTSQEFHTI